MAINLTKDHHLLTRNLKLNGKYISNDGGDEGITVDDGGIVTASSQLDIGNMSLTTSELDISSGDFTLDVAGDITLDADGDQIYFRADGDEFIDFDAALNTSDITIYKPGDTANYCKVSVGSNGQTTISTVDYSIGALGHLKLSPDGQLQIHPTGGGRVDIETNVVVDINETGTTTETITLLHLDLDSQGTMAASQTLTNIGIDLDINRDNGDGEASSATNSTGIDIDIVGHDGGSTTNTGINIAVSEADTNYALITSGGNVGIGVANPDQALEVNGDIHVENTVYFTAETANTIADGATGVIDWNTSQKQKVTITGTGITCNFTDPAGPCNLLLKVVQGDGSDVIATWDAAIKWPTNDTVPTLSTGNGDIDIISFYFDGTNYFGVATLDFA